MDVHHDSISGNIFTKNLGKSHKYPSLKEIKDFLPKKKYRDAVLKNYFGHRD